MRYMITENQVHTGTKQINLQVHVMIRNIRPEYHISRYILHVYTERDITYQVLYGRQYERLLFPPSFGTTSALFRFSSCFFLFTSFIRVFFPFSPLHALVRLFLDELSFVTFSTLGCFGHR